MKSYLSLIPISAKVRKRQNRMTMLCIIISVGYDDFQHGRYGDPNGKDTSDQRTWELAYHVEGAIRATD